MAKLSSTQNRLGLELAYARESSSTAQDESLSKSISGHITSVTRLDSPKREERAFGPIRQDSQGLPVHPWAAHACLFRPVRCDALQ